MRQFIHTRGVHYKFWTVERVDDRVVRCVWGRVGTVGQTKTWVFRSPYAADDYMNGKIREKLDKGYVETS